MKKTALLGCLLLGFPAIPEAQTPGSWYTISSQSKCLMPEDSKLANGSPIAVWDRTDVPSEKWTVVDNGNGSLSLRNGYNDMYIGTATSAKDGATLTGSATKRNANWIIKAVPGKSDTYNILSSNETYILMLEDTAEGSHPVLRHAENIEAATKWIFTREEDNFPRKFDEKVRDRMMTGFINQYYKPATSGYMLGSGGFWSDAEMIEVILDAFETTGNVKYKNYYQQLVSNFIARQGRDWSNNPFNDDIAWMVLACVRGYKYFGDTDYLELARENFDRMYTRAIQPGGTLRWSQDASDHGSNSCINGPAMIALCYLYEMSGEAQYLDKAKTLWNAQYNTLCDKNDGHIWDSGAWNDDWSVFKVGNYWGSTYNQGTMIGASIKLYQLTGDNLYKAYADKVYAWAYGNLTDKATPRIINACQTATGDLCGFKGILARYVRMYAEATGNETPLQWLEDNAFHAFQNRNSKGVTWSRWLSKTPENFKSVEGNEIKDFSNDAFGASTAVSAAFNSHVNRSFTKDAYSCITADMMDDIKWWQLSTRKPMTTDKGKEGAWLCFHNVKFPQSGATSVRLSGSGAEGAILAIYADRISPETLLARFDDLSDPTEEYRCDLPHDVTGPHTIYVVSEGSAPASFGSMIFDASNSITTVVEDAAKTGIFDLHGHSYDSVPSRGIYIINGIKTYKK